MPSGNNGTQSISYVHIAGKPSLERSLSILESPIVRPTITNKAVLAVVVVESQLLVDVLMPSTR